jgi:hypothetical protein
MRVPARLAVAFVALVVLTAPSAASAWTWPVEGPVLRPFSFGSDPYAAGQHRGIDIGSPTGAPVVAPAGGAVSFAGTVPTGGKTVTIQTPSGYAVTLVHLGSIAVARGAVVQEGARVGTVGPSGVPDLPEPYVYLGIRVAADDQGYVDPLLFLPPRPAPPAPTPAAEPPPAPAPVEEAPAAEAPPVAPPAAEPPAVEPAADGASASEPPETTADSGAAGEGATTRAGETAGEAEPAHETAEPASHEGHLVASEQPASTDAAAPSSEPPVETPESDAPPTAAAAAPVAASAPAAEAPSVAAPVDESTRASAEPAARPTRPERAWSVPTASTEPRSQQGARAGPKRPAPDRHAASEHPLVMSAPEPRAVRSARAVTVPVDAPVSVYRRHRPDVSATAAPARAERHAGGHADRRATSSSSLVTALAWTGGAAAAAVAAAVMFLVLRRRPRDGAAPAAGEGARIMVLLGGAEAGADPRGAGLAVRGGPAAPGSRDGIRRSGGHLRPLPPAARERRVDGERDGRARDAGDGLGGQRRRLAA